MIKTTKVPRGAGRTQRQGTPAKPSVSRRRGEGVKRVYEGLRSSILSLELVPGAVLDDSIIAEQYAVSRTPIREALVRLESEGLVTLLPNRGARVAPLDLARIKDYLEGIDLVQRAVTHWAALRRTQKELEVIRQRAVRFEESADKRDSDRMVLDNHDFHEAIAEACGNALIADTYRRFLAEGLRIARFTLNPRYYSSDDSFIEFLKSVIDEHAAMVRAIETKDTKLAESTASSHTAHTQDRFVWFLRDSLAPVVGIAPIDGTATRK